MKDHLAPRLILILCLLLSVSSCAPWRSSGYREARRYYKHRPPRAIAPDSTRLPKFRDMRKI